MIDAAMLAKRIGKLKWITPLAPCAADFGAIVCPFGAR
jgi:hypothetical protein